MNKLLKKTIATVSIIATLSSTLSVSAFADTSTVGSSYKELQLLNSSSIGYGVNILEGGFNVYTSSDTPDNAYGNPTVDGVHGATKFEDMQYIHYDEATVQQYLDDISACSTAENTEDNILKFVTAVSNGDNFIVEVMDATTIINVQYSIEPSDSNAQELSYTSELSSSYYDNFIANTCKVLNTDFGTYTIDYLNDNGLTSIADYLNSILVLGAEYSSEYIQLNAELTQKYSQYVIQSANSIDDVQVEYDGETMSYAELYQLYVNAYLNITNNYSKLEDVPEDEVSKYKALEDAVSTAKSQNGLGDELKQLYIDMVKIRNDIAKLFGYSDYVEYALQYDTDKLNALCDDVKTYIAPVYKNNVASVTKGIQEVDGISLISSPQELKSICGDVISAVGEQYKDIYDYANQYNLLITDEFDPQGGCYTTYSYTYSEPIIYISYTADSTYNIDSIFHEFGHYIDIYTNTDNWSGTSLASTENCSVSFSLICSANLDAKLDTNTANKVNAYNILSNMNTYLSGTFSDGMFEMYAYQNADTLDVDTLDQAFRTFRHDFGTMDDLTYDLGGVKEFYDLSLYNQMYSNPFYMLDYGMAGVTAFRVLDTYLTDKTEGLKLFDTLYTNDNYGDEYISIMESINLSPYDEGCIKTIADRLSTYIPSLLGASSDVLYGDINLDGKVSTADLILMKKYLLGSLSEDTSFSMENADINLDGKVSTADLTKLKKTLLGL